jgi:hypothetical protein
MFRMGLSLWVLNELMDTEALVECFLVWGIGIDVRVVEAWPTREAPKST